jgi:radical SAM superfamily enzyme YgiQ (UPF0313 family)
MMRTLLVRATPPGLGRAGYVPSRISPPLGLLQLAAVLRHDRRGDVVRIVDAAMDLTDARDLSSVVDEFGPDLVGLSGFRHEASHVGDLAHAARAARPDVPIVLGGPIASAYPTGVLAHFEEIDAAAIGEAEETILEIAARVDERRDLAGVRGLALRREDGTPYTTARRPFIRNIAGLPRVDWRDIDLRAYSRTMNWLHVPLPAEGSAMLATTRGCPYRCTYCYKFFGLKVRAMPVRAVVDEMQRVVDTYGVRDFQIVDDVFNYRRNRIRELCREMASRRLDVTFSFPHGLRGDRIETGDLEALESNGLYMMSMGVETVTPRLQKMIRKNLDVDKVFAAAETAARLDVMTRGFFMLGFPTETEEEMEQTVSRAEKSALYQAMFFTVMPHPGTELFDVAVAHGFDADDWNEKRFRYEKDFINTSPLPDRVLERIHGGAIRRFYADKQRRDRLLAWLRRRGLLDHPYVHNTSMWSSLLGETDTESSRERPDRGAVASPPIRASETHARESALCIAPGLVLAGGWRVRSVHGEHGRHDVSLEGPRGVTARLFVTPREDSSPCMAHSESWNVGIVSDGPLESIPRGLTEAVGDLLHALEEDG